MFGIQMASAQRGEYLDLEGNKVYAVEELVEPNKNDISLGLTFNPIDPYYSLLGLNLSYTRMINLTWGWNILDVNYLYAVDKNLKNELAEEYSVTTQEIRKTEYLFSSNLIYRISEGKSLFFQEYVKRSNNSILFGLGSAQTNLESYPTANFGFQSNFIISNSLSVKASFISQVPFTDSTLYFLNFSFISLGLSFGY